MVARERLDTMDIPWGNIEVFQPTLRDGADGHASDAEHFENA
jgi:hypothetical protein